MKSLKLKLILIVSILILLLVVIGCASDPVDWLAIRDVQAPSLGDSYVGSSTNPFTYGYFTNLNVGGLPVSTYAVFTALLDGLVPAPGVAAGKFLKDDGTWAAIAGGGDVTAAANLVTDMITVGDGGLKGIKDTGVSIDGFDNLDTHGGDITGNDLNADNDVNVTNNLDVTDDADIGGDLDVTGAITVGTTVDGIELSDAFTAMNSPTGFENRTDSAWTFTDGTRKLEVTTGTHYHIWFAGIQHTIAVSKDITIDDTEGMHWVYFDTDNALHDYINPTLAEELTVILNKCLVGVIYWDAANNVGVYVGEERHGAVMSGMTHYYLHKTRGIQFIDGLGLGDFVIGSGALDSHAQFSTADGSVSDEDIGITISDILSNVGLPILYRDGVNGYWRTVTEAGFSVYKNPAGVTNRLMWNQLTGGSWQLTEAGENEYVLCHVFMTTGKTRQIYAIMGQSVYATLKLAREGAPTEIGSLLLGNLPSAEIRPIGTVIFETDKDYANAINARVVEITTGGDDYVDWRTNDLPRGSVPSDHGSLTGLADDDHPQYVSDTDVDDVAVDSATTDPISSNWAFDHEADTSTHGVTSTIVGVNETQELDNKTLDASVAKGTWTASGTWTLPAYTAGGNVQLGEVSILLDSTISADGKWSGVAEAGTAGATLAFGDLVYLAVLDSRWELADADSEAKTKCKIGICILAAANDGDPTTILLYGKVNAATAFPDLTIGSPLFISTTDGDIQIAAPSGSGDCIRIIGYGNTIDELFFCPESTWIELA